MSMDAGSIHILQAKHLNRMSGAFMLYRSPSSLKLKYSFSVMMI